MINLRTRSGACKVISCTTKPPIEKPNRSTCFRPSALMKAMASAPICSNVVGTSPELLETPALSNKIHLPVASQAIRHRRIPVVHGAEVVLAKDERHSSGLAEAAIGEADSVGLYELCRRGLVCVVIHNESPCAGSVRFQRLHDKNRQDAMRLVRKACCGGGRAAIRFQHRLCLASQSLGQTASTLIR